MRYRTIPAISQPVSELAFGCGPGASLMVQGDEQAQEEAIAAALDRGINFFDTAALYGTGKSESNLGRVLSRLDAHPRTVVLTKIQVTHEDTRHLDAAVRTATERSKRRLQRDVIDIVLLHNRIGPPQHPAERSPSLSLEQVVGKDGVLHAFERLQRDGSIRAYGLSTFRSDPAEVARVIEAAHADVINASFNLLNPSAGYKVGAGYASNDLFEPPNYDQLIDLANDRNIKTIAIQPLGAGVLGKGGTAPPLPELRAFATAHGMTLLQLAASFCLAKPGVTSVAWGFRSMEQMTSGVEAAAAPPLSATDVEKLLDAIGAHDE